MPFWQFLTIHALGPKIDPVQVASKWPRNGSSMHTKSMDILQEDIAVEWKKRRVTNQRDKDVLQSVVLLGMMAKLAKIQEKAENALKVSCPPGIL
jgi:hypothetical protein